MSRTRHRNSVATDSARTRSEIGKKLTPKVYESPMGPTKRRITRSCTKSQSRMAEMKSPSPSPAAAVAVTPTKVSAAVDGGGDMGVVEKGTPDCSPCATPKAEKFRIPEINTCPPAPKKRRVLDYSSTTTVRRRPIAFFAPPDVEMFFFVALRDIPAT